MNDTNKSRGTGATESFNRRSFLAASGVAGLGLGADALLASETRGRREAHADDDVIYLSAVQLAKKIRKKQVLSEEAVTAYLERIKLVNPHINAAVYVAGKAAIVEARKADRAIAQGTVDWHRQPLFGVPVSFKDHLDTKGVPTTAGTPALKDRVPKLDAMVVQKMKRAGAILLAKTNMPMLGMSFDTSNLVFGQTNNPYNLTRIPGGSSGGEAALLSAAGSALGIGGDGTGSIRVPCHFCGIAGLVPSWGRVSSGGIYPLVQNNGPFFFSNGPMARSVEDLSLAMSIIEGMDPLDPFTFPLAPVGSRLPKLKDLRIAYFTETKDVTPVDSIVDTVEKSIEALAKCCGSVKKRRPPPYDRESVFQLNAALVASGVLVETPKNQKEYGGEKDAMLNDLVRKFKSHMKTVDQDVFAKLKEEAPIVQRNMLGFMQDFDAVICPPCSQPAMKHGTVWDHGLEGAFIFTELFSLVGALPKGVVRCGTSSEGLPIGVQVVGAPWRDDVVLAILAHLEKEFGGWQKPSI